MPPTRETHPTMEVRFEIPAKASRNMITVPTDIGPQLARIETILDRILRSLAPLAGAR